MQTKDYYMAKNRFSKFVEKLRVNVWKILSFLLILFFLLKFFGGTEQLPYMQKSYNVRSNDLDNVSFKSEMIVADESFTTIAEEERKIIKNANFEIQVKDGEKSYIQLTADLKNFDAFVDTAEISETYLEGSPKKANITVRVNVRQFDKFVELVRAYGYVKSENISNQDVTKSYSDMEAELTNLKLREEKVREFYNNAKTVDETLSIYRELSAIQAEIDKISRDLQNLDQQVTYSTISILFSPEIKITEFQNPDWNVAIVWKESVNNLLGSLQWIAAKMIIIVVYAPIWLLLLIVGLLVRRKFF